MSTSQSSSSIRTDYSRWRPYFHLQPRSGWLNDPCAPGYDPSTKSYFLAYQWNPDGPDWGNICWGRMTSEDMIHWSIDEKAILRPDAVYDSKGVFTGCLIPPVCLNDEAPLTVAYTSVSALPIHYTVKHQRGSESLSLASSFDHGQTWEKLSCNPILPSEPSSLEVTGWRDPYVGPWHNMDRLLGTDVEHSLFGIISGGIKDKTPTVFLYSIDSRDLTSWTELGPLINPGRNICLSRWSGDLGLNWEVANFMTLSDECNPSVSRDYLVMGVEGCLASVAPKSDISPGPSRPARSQTWLCGSLRKRFSLQNAIGPNRVYMSYDYGGHLDHGCFYAANSFFDPITKLQIVWGWITEDDLCDELRHAQGWSGLLSLPREVVIQTLVNVIGTIGPSKLDEITSIETQADEHGSYTIRTLASRPVQRLVEALREGLEVRTTTLGASKLGNGRIANVLETNIQSNSWELECSFRLSSRCQRIGVSFAHSEDSADSARATTLTFDPIYETFTIERPSLEVPDSAQFINSSTERAPHTLFSFRDPNTGTADSELLEIRAWRDNSVLEVFVNGRTAISTRIYAADKTYGMSFFAHEATSEVNNVTTFNDSELVSMSFRDGIGLK